MSKGKNPNIKNIENNYAFIDSQNLNLGIKSNGRALDFRKFRIYLRDKYKVHKAFLFIGYIESNEKLYSNLEKYGYILIFKPILQRTENRKVVIKGNVDAELVLHTMIELNNFDKAIIVSGDGDFYCLIEYLSNNNKLLKVLTPSEKHSGLLRKFGKGDYIVQLAYLKEILALEKK